MNEEAIFNEALEQPDPDKRAAFLHGACNGNALLRRRVEALLSAYGAGEFLESPAAGLAAMIEMVPDGEPDSLLGTEIGPYKLLEQIGEGGMGVVYMALQEKPVRRKVALKIIKPGMDTRQVVARFEAERQALALMDHPSIARVLDAGATETGRPYFVMELVRGIPITDFCIQEGLDYRQRLELFVAVCHAVQHAHQKGVIHRDLKPSNVLVTMQDGRPLVKVIDFGVAKAIGQQLTEKTLFTGFAQLIGTPLYMSPEQAALSAVDVDTRSDVYSLGVLLYELLTDTTPFDKATVARAAYEEIRRMIREDEPPRPSARISTLKANALTTRAGRQSTGAQKLSRQLRGELDWIVMKALDKDRNRRYESPSAFAADVQRFLADEPVEASPPSTLYRLRKLAQRHRAILAMTALLVAVLVTATAISLWQALRATQASTLARAERQLADAHLQTAGEAVDRMLLRVADESLAAIPNFEPVRRALLQDAVEFYERLLEQQAGDPKLRLSSARAWSRIANLHYLLVQWDEVRPAYEQSCRILEELRTENPDDRTCTRELAETYQALAHFEFHRAWSAESAEPFLLRAIPLRMRLSEMEPDVDEHKLALLSLQNDWMEVQERLGRKKLTNREKEERLRQDLQTCEELVRRHPDDPAYRRQLAAIYVRLFLLQAKEQPEQAEQMFYAAEAILKEALEEAPTDHEARRLLAWAISSWAHCLRQLDRHAEAAEALRGAIAVCDEGLRLSRNLPDDLALRAYYRNHLGAELESAGKLAEAEGIYRQTLEDIPFHGTGQRRNAIERLARLLIKQRRFAEAAACCQSVMDAAEQDLLEEPHDRTPRDEILAVRLLLMEIFEAEGKYAEAAREGAAIPRTLPKLGDYFRAAAVLSRTARLAERDEHTDGGERSLTAATCRQRAKEILQEASALLEADMKQSATPRWYESYQLALCRLGSGDQRGYRAACGQMLRRFGQSRNADALHFTAWSCSLAAGAVDDYSSVLELARRDAQARPSDARALQTLGAALFRAGQFQAALEALAQAAADPPTEKVSPAYGWYFLVMTHQRLGQHEEAQAWFDKAAAYTEQALASAEAGESLPWNRRLTLELLGAEAAAMLEQP